MSGLSALGIFVDVEDATMLLSSAEQQPVDKSKLRCYLVK